MVASIGVEPIEAKGLSLVAVPDCISQLAISFQVVNEHIFRIMSQK